MHAQRTEAAVTMPVYILDTDKVSAYAMLDRNVVI
jgi:hypothetical protein